MKKISIKNAVAIGLINSVAKNLRADFEVLITRNEDGDKAGVDSLAGEMAECVKRSLNEIRDILS